MESWFLKKFWLYRNLFSKESEKFNIFLRYSMRKRGCNKHKFCCNVENHFCSPHFFHGKPLFMPWSFHVFLSDLHHEVGAIGHHLGELMETLCCCNRDQTFDESRNRLWQWASFSFQVTFKGPDTSSSTLYPDRWQRDSVKIIVLWPTVVKRKYSLAPKRTHTSGRR